MAVPLPAYRSALRAAHGPGHGWTPGRLLGPETPARAAIIEPTQGMGAVACQHCHCLHLCMQPEHAHHATCGLGLASPVASDGPSPSEHCTRSRAMLAMSRLPGSSFDSPAPPRARALCYAFRLAFCGVSSPSCTRSIRSCSEISDVAASPYEPRSLSTVWNGSALMKRGKLSRDISV
jgi:hypothetical protein